MSTDRTPEEILTALDDRFSVNTTPRSLPLHMASPPPAHDRQQKHSMHIGIITRAKKTRRAGGQFQQGKSESGER